MATWPTPKVELALGSDPYDTTPTWVDVTAYVRDDPGVMSSRGNVGQLGAPVTTGTCSFLLDNRTRRFDPSYAAGPYFGQLKARCQVRVTATWSAVDYVIFRGFITGPQVVGTDGGKDSVVQIVAYDALSILARTLLSGADVLLLDEPTAHLDPGTEQTVLDAIDLHTRGRTVIVVSHREGPVRLADRVLELRDGVLH